MTTERDQAGARMTMTEDDAAAYGAMTIWTVYDSPVSKPGFYVARKYKILGGSVYMTDEIICDRSLDRVRDLLQGMGLFKLMRDPDDPSHIVESWI